MKSDLKRVKQMDYWSSAMRILVRSPGGGVPIAGTQSISLYMSNNDQPIKGWVRPYLPFEYCLDRKACEYFDGSLLKKFF